MGERERRRKEKRKEKEKGEEKKKEKKKNSPSPRACEGGNKVLEVLGLREKKAAGRLPWQEGEGRHLGSLSRR